MVGTASNTDRYESCEPYIHDLEGALALAHVTARENIGQSQHRQKKIYDRRLNERCYGQGDVVYLADSSSRIGQSKKLRKPWIGPFVVTTVISSVLYRIKDRRREQVVHHDRLKLCHDSDIPLWVKRLRHAALGSDIPVTLSGDPVVETEEEDFLDKEEVPVKRSPERVVKTNPEVVKTDPGLPAEGGRSPRKRQVPVRLNDYDLS